jgi:hypothetical protein
MKHQPPFHTDSALSPSWPIRWEQARGTYSETAVLMSIAAEENALNGASDLYCAAYDAALATDADERAEFIAELERLFNEANEGEAAAWWTLDVDFLRDERAEQRSFGL